MKSVTLHNRLTNVFLKSLTLLLLLSFSFSSQAQEVDEARQKEGRKIFKSLCASCHKLDKKLIGPALGNVEERRENDWLKAWIKDNAALSLIHAFNQSFSLRSSTPPKAGPINFLSNLWQEAHKDLNNFLPSF